MKPSSRFGNGLRLRKYVWILMVFWSAAVGVTLVWELTDEREQALDVARAEARGVFRRDAGLLRWYAARGGLYVPAETRDSREAASKQPSEAGPGASRGGPPALIDPPQMFREIREYSSDEMDIRTHFASISARHADDRPDPWEEESLEALSQGVEEVSTTQSIHGKTFVRLMRPVIVESSCMKCHSQQAYRIGELKGGISVSVPLDSVWPPHEADMIRRIFGYGGMWLFGFAGIWIGARLVGREIERRRQAESQILAARRIQEQLLPAAPPRIPGFEIAAANFPAEYASGDYFDWIPMGEGRLALVVADVSGHGLGPAVLTASTQAFLRSVVAIESDPALILCRANRFLATTFQSDQFITLFFGQLDAASRTFRYLNAGHPTCYVFDSEGNVKAALRSLTLPLGVLPDTEFPAAIEVALADGDLVLLLTDGLLEAARADGTMFGKERVIETVRSHGRQSARDVVQSLHEAVRTFSGSQTLDDDVTVLAVRVAAGGPHAPINGFPS